MDRETRDLAEQWLVDRTPAIVVEVSETQGSAPREAGTRMLVSASQTIGTIGGGHLEWKALQTAREMLRSGECSPHTEHWALGPALGQCCGGTVTLVFRLLDEKLLAQWPEPAPLFHLQLYGAGHVGRAIATLLATLDGRVDWIDERDDAFPALTRLGTPWPPHIRRVCVDAVEGEVRNAPPGAHFLVLTHQHDLDMRITEAILRRGDFGSLGLIGSTTKRRRFVHRFEQRGIAPDVIARLTCPIGIDGIADKAPEQIAIAVVAQLLVHAGQQRPQPDRGKS